MHDTWWNKVWLDPNGRDNACPSYCMCKAHKHIDRRKTRHGWQREKEEA